MSFNLVRINFIFSLLCLLGIYSKHLNKLRGLQFTNQALQIIYVNKNYENFNYYTRDVIPSSSMNSILIPIYNREATNTLQIIIIDNKNFDYQTIDVGKINNLFKCNNYKSKDIIMNMLKIDSEGSISLILAIFSIDTNTYYIGSPNSDSSQGKLYLTFLFLSRNDDSSKIQLIKEYKFFSIMDSPLHRDFNKKFCGNCNNYQIRCSVYVPYYKYIAALVLYYDSEADLIESSSTNKIFLIAVFDSNINNLKDNYNVLLKTNILDENFLKLNIEYDDLFSIKEMKYIPNSSIVILSGLTKNNIDFLITINLNTLDTVNSNIGNLILSSYESSINVIKAPYNVYDPSENIFITADISYAESGYYSIDFNFFKFTTNFDSLYGSNNSFKFKYSLPIKNFINKLSCVKYIKPYIIACESFKCISYALNFTNYTMSEFKSIDLFNEVLINNIENFSSDPTGIKLIFTGQSLLFQQFIIGRMSMTKEGCLFYSSTSTNKCQLQCAYYQTTYADKTCFYKAICNYNGSYLDYKNNMCVNSCSSGYYFVFDGNNICLKNSSCPDGYYRFTELNVYKCVLECPSGYYYKQFSTLECTRNKNSCNFISERFCFDKFDIKCVSEFQDYESSPNQCISDQECQSKFIYIIPIGSYNNINNLCVNNCPKGYYALGNICKKCYGILQSGICFACKFSDKYFYNNECFIKCPNKLYPNILTYECQDPLVENKFVSKGFLDNICPKYYFPNNQRECLSCKDSNLYYYEENGLGKCISTCPTNFYIDQNNNCLNCDQIDINNNSYKNICCANLLYDVKKCPYCKDSIEYLFNQTCVKNCPINTKIDENLKICTDCKDFGQHLFNNTCVTQCPSNYTLIKSENICKFNVFGDTAEYCLEDICNGETCLLINNQIKCICPSFKAGTYCEFDIRVILKSINYTGISNNIKSQIDKIPGPLNITAFSKEIYDHIIIESNNYNTITNKFPESKNGTKAVIFSPNEFVNNINEELVSVKNTLKDAYSKNSTDAIDKADNLIKKIQDTLSNTLNSFITYNNKNNVSTDVIILLENVKVQVYVSSMSEDDIKKKAVENKIAYVNLTLCKDNILKKLNLTENDLVIQKTELSNIQDLVNKNNNISKSEQVSFDIYLTKTGEKLDLEKYCGDIKSEILLPVDQTKIDLKKYKEFKNKSINIFDEKDKFYTDICLNYQNSSSGKDVPLKSRVKDIDPGIKINCGTGCEFLGLDDDYYAVCSCVNKTRTNPLIAEKFVNYLVFDSNSKIFFCYEKAFNKEILKYNIGFYANLVLLFGTFLFLIIFLFFPLTKTSLRVKRNCQIYTPSLSSFEDFLKFDILIHMKVKVELNETKHKKIFASVLTEVDINYLTTKDMILYDDRTYWHYFVSLLLNKHSLFSVFNYDTILKPRNLKVIIFFFNISMQFAMNALWYSDDLIDSRNLNSNKNQNEFIEVMQDQLGKSIWGFLLGSIPGMIVEILLEPSERSVKKLNEHLLTFHKQYIKQGVRQFYRDSINYYLCILFLAFLFNCLAWYYVTAFCAVYIYSGMSWFYGGLLSLLIGWVIVEILKPISHLTIRYLAKTYTKSS